MAKSPKLKEETEMTNWNAWNTNSTETPKEDVSVWGTRRVTPKRSADTQQSVSGQTEMQISHVYKKLPVFTTILPNHIELNKYLKQVILEHRQNNPETTESNVKAWHSSWQTHVENPKFQPLIDIVLNACKFISHGYFQTQDLDFSVFNCWASMYEKGEHTIKHSHFPSDFACTYYVDLEPGSSPIIFETPNNDGVNDDNKPLIIQPQNGMLAIWPALMHHEVPPTETKRMVVAMNIDKGYRT